MKKILKQTLTILISFLIFISCDKEANRVPEIPPAETMVIDFGNLTDSEKSALLSNTNWLYSATTVGVWNILIGVTFAVPVASFVKAIHQSPVKIANRTWEWKYSIDGFSGQYSARLVGEIAGSEVLWEMYITKTGVNPFDEFLWFEGNSALDGNSGQWVLNHSPEFPEEVILINWQKENEEVNSVSYSYTRELDNNRQPEVFNGSYIVYGLKDQIFDAYVNIHAYNQQEESFVDTKIEWKKDDFSGHVKAEHFYGDTNWHCWDSDGNDTQCYE